MLPDRSQSCVSNYGLSSQGVYAHGSQKAAITRTRATGKFGNMEVSEAKRLKELEAENAKLKRLLADAMLDKAALKELLSKKW